jgi:hypothetical protein
MASVSQPLVQVVNVDPDGSNWGVGRGIGTTTPVPSGGSGDCICDRSGATPGDTGVDGGGGTVMLGCWASALPDSKANPSAAIADNLIMSIRRFPIGDFGAAFPFSIPVRKWGGSSSTLRCPGGPDVRATGVKSTNREHPAVKREEEEDSGKERWR